MIEKEWSLTIIRAQNGFILRSQEEIEDGRYRQNDIIVEETEVQGGDVEAVQQMLYEVLNYFGLGGSKHDKERIRIEIEKQNE